MDERDQQYTIENVMKALTSVTYPGTKKNLVDSGMVEDKPEICDKKVRVTLTFARQTDPFLKSTVAATKAAIRYFISQDTPIEIDTRFRQSAIEQKSSFVLDAKNIIAVSSGKGGVGKSTIATNLAIALSRLGNRTALLDADILGPSIPKMFGIEDMRPEALEKDEKVLIKPIERYGIKLMSIGFFIKPGKAAVWRGAMATNALRQILEECDWGSLDYLIIDTPPGTGDIHLTLLQSLSITGVVIVTTPQDVALADARKGVDMYLNDKVNVPILGFVENMSWFTPAELPDHKYYIFGKDGGKRLSEEFQVPLLAQIPLIQSICESSDSGTPEVIQSDNPMTRAFISLAQGVVSVTNRRNKEVQPTRRVEVKRQ